MAGVFGLKKVYKRQVTNLQEGLDLSIPNLQYGYFGGGYNTPLLVVVSTVDRLDFTTETVRSFPPINLSTNRSGSSAASSASHGYFGGGYTLPLAFYSNIDRFDFATESSSTAFTSLLSQSKSGTTATSNNYYGYFAGGYFTPVVTRYSTIDRLDFATQTISAPTTKLSETKSSASSTSNPFYAYFAGGNTASYVCTIDRLDFSTETRTVPTSKLTQSKEGLTAISSTLYAYFGGGSNSPTSYFSTIDRLDYSNDTVSIPVISGKLSQSKFGLSSVYNPSYGYFAGGGTINPPAVSYSTIDRLDLTTETVSVPTSKLTGQKINLSSASINRIGSTKLTPRYINWSESATTGYYGGGYFTTAPGADYAEKSFISRLDFSNETVNSSPSLKRIIKDAYHTSTQSPAYGYFQQAYDRYFERLDFNSETVLRIPAKIELGQESSDKVAISNKDYGYFGSGYMQRPATPPGTMSTIHRLDFTTESLSLLSQRLQVGHGQGQFAKNNFYGYFINGYYLDTPAVSPVRQNTVSIERIDFSTEVTSMFPSISRSRASFSLGNSSDSYSFYGNSSSDAGDFISSIYRFDLSTEVSSLLSSKLSQSSYFCSGTQNNNYGFIAGGIISPYNSISTIDRFDLSTNTVTTPTSKLTESIATFGGISGGAGTRKVGKATYGYFGGGTGTVSTIERLDFTTETIAPPSVTSRLSQSKLSTATVSNNYYGYFAGGAGGLSNIDRLDFSSETVNTSSSKLNEDYFCGTSSSSYGYFGGGYNPESSTISRIDFNTETISTPPSKLSQARFYLSSVANNSYGYFGGGSVFPSYYCTIDRLDFSTETRETPGTYQLSSARGGPFTVYNHSYGYFGGGYQYLPTVTLYCTIDRLDFSTETRATPGTYQLTQSRGASMGVSSSAYGYFGGGYLGPSVQSSKIDRLDFSAETISVPSQNLTSARYGMGTVSNSQ